MTAAVPRMGKDGKVVLFVVMVVVVVVIVVVVKVERRIGSRQVESSGRSGSRGSFLQLGVVINGDLNFGFVRGAAKRNKNCLPNGKNVNCISNMLKYFKKLKSSELHIYFTGKQKTSPNATAFKMQNR
jgi:hypothetical protein